MPNHCENDLLVSGPSDKLKEFRERVRGPDSAAIIGGGEAARESPLSAHKFIPVPEEFQKDVFVCRTCPRQEPRQDQKEFDRPECPDCGSKMATIYDRDGYDWCIEHWGTKWGLYDVELLDEDLESDTGCLTYTFLTAWSPPLPVIREMGRQWPELDFDLKYYEGGMAFQGVLICQDGEVVSDWSEPYFGPRGG